MEEYGASDGNWTIASVRKATTSSFCKQIIIAFVVLIILPQASNSKQHQAM